MVASLPLARRVRVHGVALVLSAATALSAQSAPPLPVRDGFDARTRWTELSSPFGLAGVAPGTAPGELYFAVDHLLWRLDAQGIPHVAHALGAGDSLGFVGRAGSVLLFSDRTRDQLHVRDLGNGAQAVLPLPANSFDLAVTPSGQVLVSASPLWPAPGARAGIWLLDPNGGAAHREIAALTGPSGPLAVDPRTGDLIYATQSDIFPTPPGSTSVLRFPAARVAAAIAGAPPLTARDARALASNLDGAYDLEFDDRGCLYVSDPTHGGVLRFLPDGRLDPVPVVARGREKTTALSFVDRGPGTFDPYQPEDSGALLVVTADWVSLATIREVRPARPGFAVATGPTSPPGPVRLVADGLPPGQPALLMISSLPALPAERELLRVSGVPVWTDLDLHVPLLSALATTDPQGRVQIDLVHSGGLGWSLTLAMVGTTDPSAGDPLLATTPSAPLTLLP